MGDAITEAVSKADAALQANQFQEVYDTLVAHKEEKGHCELQWKLARAARDLAQLDATSAERKKSVTYEGMAYAENAVAADDNNFSAHKWKGILLSDVSKFEGYKVQIQNAYKIRDEFQRAADLNPEDATCWHLLGEWCFNVAGMSWMQRKFASALFGTPPSATFEDAIKNYTQAEQKNPGFYVGNFLSLGKSYSNLKKKAEAKEWLQKAADYTAENEKDEKMIQEAKSLLKGL